MGKTKKGTALLLAFTLCASILTPNSVDAAKVKKPVLSKKKLTLVRDKSATIRLKKAGKCKVDLVFFRQKRLQDYKKEKNFLQIQSGRKRFRQNQMQGKKGQKDVQTFL